MDKNIEARPAIMGNTADIDGVYLFEVHMTERGYAVAISPSVCDILTESACREIMACVANTLARRKELVIEATNGRTKA